MVTNSIELIDRKYGKINGLREQLLLLLEMGKIVGAKDAPPG